jgi:hypothetical protein
VWGNDPNVSYASAEGDEARNVFTARHSVATVRALFILLLGCETAAEEKPVDIFIDQNVTYGDFSSLPNHTKNGVKAKTFDSLRADSKLTLECWEEIMFDDDARQVVFLVVGRLGGEFLQRVSQVEQLRLVTGEVQSFHSKMTWDLNMDGKMGILCFVLFISI